MIFDDFIGVFMAQIISLWAYSCNLYQQERVKSACLHIQESDDIDVTALLFCCWFSTHYQPLSSSQIMGFKSQVRLWSEHCIRPLRRVRQQMKPLTGNTIDPNVWQQVREQVKTLELQAEKQLLNTLEQLVFDQPHLYILRNFLGAGQNKINLNAFEENTNECTEGVKNLDDTVNLLRRYFADSNMLDDPKGIEALGDILHAAYPEIQYHSVLKKLTKR